MGEIEILKVGDMVLCHHSYHTGIGYGKVIKIVNRNTKEEFQEFGPLITGRGDNNSKIDVTIKIVGYDLRDGDNEDDLGEIVEIEDTRIVDAHGVYRILTEEMISEIKDEWDRLVKNKLNFFYKHVNKDKFEGKKILNKLNIT